MVRALSHSMVPYHQILTDEEAAVQLTPWGIVDKDGIIDKQKLPPIAMDDPALFDAAIQSGLGRPAGVTNSWPLDQVVRIERRSVFSGVSVFYRVVVSDSAFGEIRKDGGGIWKVFGRDRADLPLLDPNSIETPETPMLESILPAGEEE
jgi:DNA-directed RNA polymerase subunit H (RpoH/RPB5)